MSQISDIGLSFNLCEKKGKLCLFFVTSFSTLIKQKLAPTSRT